MYYKICMNALVERNPRIVIIIRKIFCNGKNCFELFHSHRNSHHIPLRAWYHLKNVI